MAEEKELKTTGRQLKIKGMGEEAEGKGKKEKKEKESKIWVFILLVVTIGVSLLFSARAENGWLSQIGKKPEKVEMVGEKVKPEMEREINQGGIDWFGTAVYEFD